MIEIAQEKSTWWHIADKRLWSATARSAFQQLGLRFIQIRHSLIGIIWTAIRCRATAIATIIVLQGNPLPLSLNQPLKPSASIPLYRSRSSEMQLAQKKINR